MSLGCPGDTDPEAYRVQLEIYRRMSPEQRLLQALRLTTSTRELAEAGIRARHPEYDEASVRRAYVALVHGVALAHEVWPHQAVPEP